MLLGCDMSEYIDKSQQLITSILLVVVTITCLGGCRKPSEEQSAQSVRSVKSEDLERTVIVPTLDSQMSLGKNVIWCSSFQLAWNKLKQDIIGEPVQIENAHEMSDMLNTSKVTHMDVPEESCYVAAGFVKDGILSDIKDEMTRRFPSEAAAEFDELSANAIVAYAFLLANVKFSIPYFENKDEFLFTDSNGVAIPISSFGIRLQDGHAYKKLREQVQVLYQWRDPNSLSENPDEFAVDLCRKSKPNQIVLAAIKPEETLKLTLASLEKKISDYSKMTKRFQPRPFGPNDVLLVPNIFWRVFHHFHELEDNSLLNKGFEIYFVREASQMIQFRLDRSGAELKSEAKVSEARVSVAPAPTYYTFDSPFLIYIKKRGAERPFFVMWIDNSELLSKI